MQTTIVGALVAALAAYSVMEHQARVRLRAQNEALQRQMADLQKANEQLATTARRRVAPHLPAPPVNTRAAAPAEDSPTTNLFYRFRENTPLLTSQQVDAFLQRNGRKAASLLAAYRTSRDVALLKEALEKYPNDPMVAFEAQLAPELSADEKRTWLATFEKDAPDNALANYLSAMDAFNSGKPDRALKELAGAAGKSFDDYSVNRVQDDSEAYLSAGYSTAEADVISSQSLIVMQLPPLKQLGMHLVDLAGAYSQSGDPASAQAVLQMAMNLGQSLENAPSSAPILISQLVGMAIQNRALGAMDPNTVYGSGGQTVQQMLDQIAQHKAMINSLDKQAQPLMPKLTDEDLVSFESRRQLFGEVPAMQWVVNKYGQQ